MNKVAIVTDSAGSIPDGLIQEYGIPSLWQDLELRKKRFEVYRT